MSRIALATDIKNRTGGSLNKDAKILNAYVETKPQTDPNNPPESSVRKRPIAQGGVVTGSGIAQGGIGMNLGNTLFVVNGDTITNYTGGGTNWNSGTFYYIGDMVSEGFVDYWPTEDNVNTDPKNNPGKWSTTFKPRKPRLSATPSGTRITVSTSDTYVVTGVYPARVGTTTRTYITTLYGTSIVIDSGSGTQVRTNLDGVPPPSGTPATFSYNSISPAAEMAAIYAGWIGYGIVFSYPPGYDYYMISGFVDTAGSMSGGGIGSPY